MNLIMHISFKTLKIVFTSIIIMMSYKPVSVNINTVLPFISGYDFDALVEGVTLDDVTGGHNPHMIGIWGGMLTHESWFLRFVRYGWRKELLVLGLNHYRLHYNRYPTGIDELIGDGFMPFTPLDPVTGEAYNFHATSIDDPEDYLSTVVKSSENTWSLTHSAVGWMDNSYQITEVFINRYAFLGVSPTEITEEYYSLETMRGSFLSKALFLMFRDYQTRTRTSPDSMEEMMSGMNQYTEGFQYCGITDPYVSSFYFGVDVPNMKVISVWFDTDGNMFRFTAQYGVWVEGGWTEVPSWNDLAVIPCPVKEFITETPATGYTDTSLPAVIYYQTGLDVEISE